MKADTKAYMEEKTKAYTKVGHNIILKHREYIETLQKVEYQILSWEVYREMQNWETSPVSTTGIKRNWE